MSTMHWSRFFLLGLTYKISASVKAIPGDCEELPSEFKVIETPTCKFTKPRAKKED